MQDGRHLENRKIAISERPSAILNLKKIILTACALQRQVPRHRAKFRGDRSYCCRDIGIFRVCSEM